MSAWIVGADEAIAAPDIGGKARALAQAQRAGLPVPPWLALSRSAFFDSLTPEQRRTLEAQAEPAAIERLLATLALAPSIAAPLTAAVHQICPGGELVAVRSSASDEDGLAHSYAGQLESFLNVPHVEIAARVADVWRSGFSPRVLAYRREHGLDRDVADPPAVLIQRMVPARVAGVAFGADPTTGRREVVVVSAVRGLGTALVSGEADADSWKVDRGGAIIERHVAAKRHMHVADAAAAGGVRTADVPVALVCEPALTDAEIQRVADLARAAGRYAGRPQDIEWAIADTLVLLQSRPITSLAGMADPDARLTIWDNSNIVESYSGVTTALTFSFAREIYQHVYRQFCRMMGVSERLIREEDETFSNMLGLVRGRMFYNLLNWYRVLALLPGYQINRRFMEQMMGVKEALPDALAADVTRGLSRGRIVDALRLTRTVAGLVVNHLTLNRRVDAFYARLERALTPPAIRLEEQRIDELVAYYRQLRGQLLLNWDAPLVNDFFTMIFYGLLRSLVTRWCDDPGGSLQNDLVGGAGGIVSAEPAVRMQTLARLAIEADLVATLSEGTEGEIRSRLPRYPSFDAELRAYLDRFGDRTVNELKLESTTLHDDPLPLLRAIGACARQSLRAASADEPTGASRMAADTRRSETRARVRQALARHPLRRLVFGWVLRHAQRRVRDRENLRLERTRLFARVRRIFLEIGGRLAADGVLDDARDVFDLEVEEILAFVDGRATTSDLRGLVATRAREFRRYAEEPEPPSRFESHGPVYSGTIAPAAQRRDAVGAAETEPADRRHGLGCCPGVVRGRVRIVTDPLRADLGRRSILVAAHTDPGWIMAFPSAAGILVERGSLLSHAAIVARELGIPTVVSLPGVTRWLKNDDWVEIDGSAGIVRRIDPPVDADAE